MVRERVPLAYREVQLLRESTRNNVTRVGTLGHRPVIFPMLN